VSKRFECRLTTFPSLPVPLIKGAQVVLHLGHAVVAANVGKLVSLTGSGGTVRKAKPRAVPAASGAVVHLVTERPICVEPHADCRALGRFVLRQAGATVAAGLVTQVL
jgi:elongation factor 1 alpha-like protein